MRLTKFSVLFPFIFIVCDLAVLYFVTLFMHYLTFSEWTFHNNLIMIAWVMIVIYNKSFNIGRGVSYLVTVENALKSIFVLLALISFGNLFFNVYEFAIINLVTGIFTLTFSVLIYRLTVHRLLDNYRKYGGNIKNIAIIGYDKKGIKLYNTILNNQHLGYRSNGVFYKKSNSKYKIPYMGKISDFINEIENYSEAYISDEIPNKVKKEVIEECDLNLVKVRILPELVNYEFKNFFISKLIDIPVIEINELPLDKWYNRLFKRIFDIIISYLVIVFILSWLIPLFGIIIKIQSKGPILFTQSRNGENGIPFKCYKFRSMILNKNSDRVFADHNDKRLTKFGRFIRISALDELPQFINVFLGDMSIIGPRPHPILLNKEYELKIEKFNKRHQFKPGITGLAQISGYRGRINNLSEMSSRVKLDRYYFKNWSLFFDFKIFFKTLFKMIKFNLS
ncbi:MAG: exopolysaccharide biosynthesis polyprenyl glycosylphosphotransferase [Bacteroidota bacterium]|nr:exopolysaccharide biosynthesis polyprenyl glycosylphosphotransferase [Bacteroidota bacterium]MEE2604603.1 exopolysaccharide biosynthesis polyprenyl glycosylphosphotransferase [Bacteroidota bacterium]